MADSRKRIRHQLEQPVEILGDPYREPLTDTLGPQPEEPSVFDSFFSAASSANLTAEAARAYEGLTRFAPEQDFDPISAIGRDEKLKKWILPLMDQDEAVSEAVLLTTSTQELNLLADQMVAKAERLQVAFDNGITPGIAGMFAGSILDLPSLIPGVALVKGLTTVGRAAQSARAVGATRLGMFGAAEQAAFVGLESVTDPTVTGEEVILQTLAAGGIGAGLGAAFPALAGVRRFDPTPEAAEEALAKAPRTTDGVAPESAGAAATPAGAGTDLPAGPRGPKGPALSSPSQRVWANAAIARDQLIEKGYTSMASAFDVAGRIVRFAGATQDEVAGRTVRTHDTAEDVFKEVQEETGSLARQTRHAWQDTLQQMYGTKMPIRMRDVKHFGVSYKLPKRAITESEFRYLADEVAYARFHGEDIGAILDEIPDLTPPQRDVLEKALDAQAARDNDYYDVWRRRIIEDGLANESQLPRGPYRPQRYNIPNVQQHAQEFEDWLRIVMHEEPPASFLEAEGFVQPGGSYRDLLASDPEAAEDARFAFIGKNARELERKAEESLKAAQAELKDGQEELEITRMQRKADRLSARIKKMADGKEKRKAERALLRLDQDIKSRVEDWQHWTGRQMTATELQTMAKRAAQRQKSEAYQKRKIKRAETKVTDAEGRLLAAARKADTETDISAIRMKILGKGQPGNVTGPTPNRFGFLDEDFDLPEAQRLMPRMFDLSRGYIRRMESTKKFLTHDSAQSASHHVQQVGSRWALKKALNGESTPAVLERLSVQFDEDIKAAQKAGDTKAARQIEKMRKETMEDLTTMIARFTGTEPGSHGTGAFWSSQITRMNVVSMLGSALFTVFADIMTLEFASGRVGGAFRTMFRGMKNSGLMNSLKELEQDELAAWIRGIDALYQSDLRQLNLNTIADVDVERGLGVPGSPLWEASRVLDQGTEAGARLMMRANLMNHWNAFLGTASREALLVDSIKEFGRWDKLSKAAKTRYARLGIGEEEAKEIAALFDKYHVKVPVRFGAPVKLPDFDKWRDAGHERAAYLFKKMVRVRGEESILNPRFGNMPHLMSSPTGRVIMQFMSFPYEAQGSFIRPAMQSPGDPGLYSAITIGLSMSILGDFLRHASRGDGDEWLERLEDPEGWAQILYTAVIRSPLAFGVMDRVAEGGLKMGGRPVNDMIEDMGGRRLIPQPGKFAEQDILGTVLGPTAGQAERIFGLGQVGLGAVTDPDDRERLLTRGIRAAPFSSLFYIRAAEAYLTGEFD